MYILFLPRVGLYVSFLPFAYAQGKTSWHKDLSVVKTIYTYGFHELFLKQSLSIHFLFQPNMLSTDLDDTYIGWNLICKKKLYSIILIDW